MSLLDPILIAEWVAIPILLLGAGLFRKLANELAGAREDTKKEIAARQKMWDEEMIRIHHKFDELLVDHKDIKRMQEEGAEKIVSLEKQHAEHERDQAVQLEILRDLKEMMRNGK